MRQTVRFAPLPLVLRLRHERVNAVIGKKPVNFKLRRIAQCTNAGCRSGTVMLSSLLDNF